MKQFTTLFALFWFLAAFALPAKAGPQKLYISISPITDAHACGRSELTLTFNNSGPTAQINGVKVDLDNHQDGLITLLGIVHSPHFHIAGGQGTSTPTFTYDQPLPGNTTVTLTLQVQYACNFFDMPNGVDGYFAKASVNWEVFVPTPATFSEDHQTPDYNIGYAAITPQNNLDAITVNYETLFDITVPLEISGNYCDNDFTVKVQKPFQCYDFSNLSYDIIVGNISYGPFAIAAQAGPNVYFEVSALSIGVPAFCEANYPNGLGHDISIVIYGFKAPCGCVTPGVTHNIPIGFSPCKAGEAPSDCKDAQGNLIMQKMVMQSVRLQVPPAGNLTITNVGSNTFGLSNHQNVWALNVSNNSDNPVYHINLDFLNAFGYQITQVEFSTNEVILNNPASTQMQVDFDQNTLSNIGLQDLDGDGFYAELGAHQSFQVYVYFNASIPHCGLGTHNACNNPCQTVTLQGPGLKATAYWNDRCNSLVSPKSAVLEHRVDIAPLTMNTLYNGAKLNYGEFRSVKMELNFGSFNGFTGYLDQGVLHRYICIKANLDYSCITYRNIKINGIPTNIQFDSNGYADLGAIAPDDLDNTTIEFDFSVLCCPKKENVINLKISYGVFFEGSTCFTQMACGDANFLSPCSGNGSKCDYFSDIRCQVYNTIFEPLQIPVPVPAKVYPCDSLRMDVTATFAQNIPGLYPMVGVMISDEFVAHLKTPYTFSGEITLDNQLLNFYDGQLKVVPDEPFDIIYFESNWIDMVNAGQVISGHFNIGMGSDFPAGFDKMDFFTPIFGFRDNGDAEVFCYQGFTDLYALEPDYSIEDDRSVSCGTGGVYNAKLIKHGGELFGPDFPGFPRVFAQIDGDVKVTIDGGNALYQGRAGAGDCTALGNYFKLPVTSLPSGLEADGDVLQSFTAFFDENCAGDVPLEVLVNVIKKDESCNWKSTPHLRTPKDGKGSFPNIVSNFDINLGNPYYISDNTYNLEVFTTNSGADAGNAWIQLEYNPSQIAIDLAGISGATSEPAVILTGACGKNVLVIPIGSLANGNMPLIHTVPLRFLEPSCSGTPLVEVYGFHSCGCMPTGNYGCAANYSGPTACADSYQKVAFDFSDSELVLKQQTCAITGTNCSQFRAAFIIDNPGEGNTGNVTLRAVLPPGLIIVNATYGRGTDFCANGTFPVDINALLTTGWTIPQGTLFGLQSGQANEMSRGYLVVLFRSTGLNSNNDNVTIIVNGVQPCGESMERSTTIFDIMNNWTIPPVGSLFFRPSNLCSQSPGISTVTVEIKVHVIADIYTPQLGYFNANMICDANDNGIADPNEPVLFTSTNSSGSPYQLNRIGTSQIYTGMWTITGDFISCANHNAILTFQTVWTVDPEVGATCVSPAVGPICGDGAVNPGPRSNLPEDLEDTKHSWRSQVQPNPFTDQLTLIVSAPRVEKAEISVFNQLGAKVFSNSYPIENQNSTSINLSLADLPPGMYVLRVAANGDMKHHVLIKH